jgi:Flp pilus assembly protein TadD
MRENLVGRTLNFTGATPGPKAKPVEEIGYPDLHHVRAAEGWIELGDPAAAARELRKLASANFVHPDVLEIRWRLHASRGQWDSALDVARLVTTVAPERPSGWIHQSYCLHELKRTPEAWQLLLPVVERFPEEGTIAYNLACYACQMGDFVAAKTWLQRALKLRGKLNLKAMALDDPDLAPMRDYLKSL